jgi:carbamoyltransferase
MNILGISCFYHDSAACLLRDGKVIAAAQEERFNRQKNSPDFPINAINFCLQAGNLTIYDIDYIGFYEKPFLKFSRVIISYLRAYPFSLKSFLSTIPVWLQDRLIMPLVFKKELSFDGKVLFIKHHLSHAASSFLVSHFEEAAILTADGIGEWATTTYGIGKGNNIKILKEINFPDSLGLLYTGVTTYLGFKANQEEGTVMGLASYGQPAYLDRFKKIVQVKGDGSFRMDQSFFGFNRASRMYTNKFIKMFGKERKPGDKIEDRHRDVAASLQKFIEETVLAMARHVYSETKSDKLCLAGGLFLNCIANNRILEEAPFKEIFIQPAAGDSGGALGVASYIYNSILDNKRNYVMTDVYLGPEFSASYIKRVLLKEELDYKELDDPVLFKYVAEKISNNKIIGWLQGRMELGPRALGNRSIIANPCSPQMKDMLNAKVKKRESFRPYAPVVLEERAKEFFRLKNLSPFMLLAPEVREDKKGLIPAVTHVDGTARVQTINKNINAKLWSLVKEFENITGIPVLINTSFNLKGEPIVCSPEDAISCFKRSQMDCLVLGNYVVERT